LIPTDHFAYQAVNAVVAKMPKVLKETTSRALWAEKKLQMLLAIFLGDYCQYKLVFTFKGQWL